MISLENVSFAYDDRTVLSNITMTISGGEFIALIGANGAGKSTLLRLAAGLLEAPSGEVLIDAKPARSISRIDIARRIGYVGQEFVSVFDFDVRTLVAMGRFPYLSLLGRETAGDRRAIEQAMHDTSVHEFRDRLVSQLSGGERQRVYLASALAQEPEFLLLDEPTRDLDIKHQLRFIEIVDQLRLQRGMGVVMITHDLNLAARHCSRWVALRGGTMSADGPAEAVLRREVLVTLFDTPLEVIAHPVDGRPLIVPGSQKMGGEQT